MSGTVRRALPQEICCAETLRGKANTILEADLEIKELWGASEVADV